MLNHMPIATLASGVIHDSRGTLVDWNGMVANTFGRCVCLYSLLNWFEVESGLGTFICFKVLRH